MWEQMIDDMNKQSWTVTFIETITEFTTQDDEIWSSGCKLWLTLLEDIDVWNIAESSGFGKIHRRFSWPSMISIVIISDDVMHFCRLLSIRRTQWVQKLICFVLLSGHFGPRTSSSDRAISLATQFQEPNPISSGPWEITDYRDVNSGLTGVAGSVQCHKPCSGQRPPCCHLTTLLPKDLSVQRRS